MITVNEMDSYNNAVTDINQKILKEYQNEIANVDVTRYKGKIIADQVTRLFSTLNETKDILVEVRAT